MTRLLIPAILFLLGSCSGGNPPAPVPDKRVHPIIIPDKMTKQLVGSYKMSIEHDPSGTPTLFVLPGNRYVIAYFGGVQAGYWQSVKDSFVVFMPDTVATPFALYGRHNPLVKDSVMITFEGFSDEPCLMAFAATTSKPVMKKIFNANADCISYPNVSLFDETAKTISFTSQWHPAATGTLQSNPVFTFSNTEGYNDFIAYHFSKKESSQPFYALYKNGKLFFNRFSDLYPEPVTDKQLTAILDGNQPLYALSPDGFTRNPLPTTGEDAVFINTMAAPRFLADTVYYNLFSKQLNIDGASFGKRYTYNATKGAYISANYIEGEEDGDPTDAYNRENILYLYKLITNATSRSMEIAIDEDPVFTYTCDQEDDQIVH